MSFQRKPGKPKTFLNEAGLHEYAVRSLGRAMRTEAELRRLMAARAEPGEQGRAAIDAVVLRLKEHGYWTISLSPRRMRGCGRRTKSWGSGM